MDSDASVLLRYEWFEDSSYCAEAWRSAETQQPALEQASLILLYWPSGSNIRPLGADLRRIEALGGREPQTRGGQSCNRGRTKSNIWTVNKDKSNIWLGLVGKVKSLHTTETCGP